MVKLNVDRWFVWALAVIVVTGIGVWGSIQYYIAELDANAAQTIDQISPRHKR